MTETKLRKLLDTHALNFRMRHYPKTVLAQFAEPVGIVEQLYEAKSRIANDRNLTPQGQARAQFEAGKAAIEKIDKWHASLLAGLDADVAAQRAALLPKTPKPDEKTVDLMLSRLQHLTPLEVSVLYNSGADSERLVMETASAQAGRLPMKSGNGLEWRPLLDPGAVAASIEARARAQNPQGVEKLNELTEIRGMHVTIAGHAVAEVKEALDGIDLERAMAG
jgi:hypothetical protein